MEQCEGGIREGRLEVRLEGEGLPDLRGDESLSTIVCSCGTEFHSQANRNTYSGFRAHRRRNPEHYEVLRFSFVDPRATLNYTVTPQDLAKAMAISLLKERDGFEG